MVHARAQAEPKRVQHNRVQPKTFAPAPAPLATWRVKKAWQANKKSRKSRWPWPGAPSAELAHCAGSQHGPWLFSTHLRVPPPQALFGCPVISLYIYSTWQSRWHITHRPTNKFVTAQP
jgi:hypothetical protein